MLPADSFLARIAGGPQGGASTTISWQTAGPTIAGSATSSSPTSSIPATSTIQSSTITSVATLTTSSTVDISTDGRSTTDIANVTSSVTSETSPTQLTMAAPTITQSNKKRVYADHGSIRHEVAGKRWPGEALLKR
jgi:hypothetical protein